MKCTNCSQELDANARFCANCGQPVRWEVPAGMAPPTYEDAPPTMIDEGDLPTPIDAPPVGVYPPTEIETDPVDQYPPTTVEPVFPRTPPPAGDAPLLQTALEVSNWQLAITQGVGAGQSFPLGLQTKIGRDPRSDIPLVDAKASRQHALIQRQDEGYVIIDQMSSNGTYVNGVLVTEPTRLGKGDTIGIGAVRLIVLGEPDNCTYCGRALIPGAATCQHCGQPVPGAAAAAAPPPAVPVRTEQIGPISPPAGYPQPAAAPPAAAPVYAPPPPKAAPRQRGRMMSLLRLVVKLLLVADIGAGLGLAALYGLYYFGYLF